MRLRFIPLSWSGGKWNTSLNEAQVYTLVLIGWKMKYPFEWGSGLYPYPDRAENGIPLWLRLRVVPLSWSGGKWNTSLIEAQVCTLILIGRKMKWNPRRKRPWWNLRILHNKSDRVFAKGRKMGSLKLEKGLILGALLLRLNSFWNCLLREMIGGSTLNRNGTVYGGTVGTQGSVQIWEFMLSKKGRNQVLKRDLKLVSGCIKNEHQALTSRQDS